MEVLLEKQPHSPEARMVNEYERRYNDVTTLAAEMLDGRMQTTFEYKFEGNELYASDGSAMGEIFEKSEEDAHVIAAKDPRLACEIRRRKTEYGEYADMINMAKGAGPNTMIVTSDAPAELEEWGEDAGGYNFKRKQTMLRVISRLPDGNIRITSQSLDGSDRDGLERIHNYLGHNPVPGELLGQRICVEVDSDRQDLLVDELTREYDDVLEEKNGGRYYGGRTPFDMDNTYNFVCEQDDLVGEFMRNETSDKNLIGFIAALENRWNIRKSQSGLKEETHTNLPSYFTGAQEMMFMAELAVQENRTYSGCGVTISAKNELGALGYGNKSSGNSDEECKFISKECPKCHKKNVETTSTSKKIEGACGCVVHK